MSEPKSCPQCFTILEADHRSETLTTVCTNCGTRSVSIAILQRHFVAPSWRRMFQRGRRLGWSKKKLCDKKPCRMRAFGLATDEGMVEVDVCHSCEQVWFDHQELEKVSKFFDVPFAQNLPGDVAEELSKIRMEAGQAVPQHTVFDFSTSDFGFQVGFEHMKKLGRKAGLAFLGFPVEHQNRVRGIPYMTISVFVLILAFSLSVFHWNQEWLPLLGFIPEAPWRWGGITALTSFFVHADYGHLIGNLYMFGVFGDNVEDKLGWRFLFLLVLGTLLGVAFHHLATEAPDAVLVGASTGISAIVTYYALSFPRQQFSMVFLFFLWVRIPVFFYVLVWVGLQFIGTLMAKEQLVATSFAGHIGGALAGFIFWISEKMSRGRVAR